MIDRSASTHAPSRGRIYLGRQSPELKGVLWDMVAEAKRDDPMAPVTIISPSRYSSLSLRQELGHKDS